MSKSNYLQMWTHKWQTIKALLLTSLSVIMAILLPIVIWKMRLSTIQSTYDGTAPGTLNTQPFELFGFFISIVLLGITWFKIKQQKYQFNWRNLKKLIPSILPLFICLNLLFILLETTYVKSSDYLCYENAAKAIINGLNPYTQSQTCYLYPPLLAQSLAFLHQIATNPGLFNFKDENDAWTTVLYIYQCAQFLQIALAYYLSYIFVKRLGCKQLPASFLVGILFLIDSPLIRTVKFDQINLWMLNSFLLSMLLVQRHPFWSGLVAAVGAHLKIYTFILLIPWTFTKRWLAVLGVAISFLVIAFIQADWGRDWTLWQQFLIYFRSPERPTNYRNNGLWSLLFNTAKIPATLLKTDIFFKLVPIIFTGISLLFLCWFILRLIQRERFFLSLIKTLNLTGEDLNSEEATRLNRFRLYGHSIDAIALSLLISPSVWEHHYVIAIPIVLWAVVTCGSSRPRIVAIGTFLIFCLPTFEIFPLSFHKLLGLLLLIYATQPKFAHAYLQQRYCYR